MARGGPINTYVVDPNGETVPEGGVDADQEQSFDDFRAAHAGTEKELSVWCFNVPTDKTGQALTRGRLGQMFTVPVDQWTMDELVQHVRDDWMADDQTLKTIRVHIRETGGGIRWNKLIEVHKKFNRDAGIKAVKSEMSEVLSEMRRMQEDSNNRLMQVIARMQERPASAPQSMDMMTMMKWMSENQTSNMQTLAVLLNAMKPTTNGANDLMTMLGAMGKIRDVASDLLPATGESDSPMGTVKALAPFAVLLKSLMDKSSTTPAPAPAAPALLTGPAPVAPAPPPPVAAPAPIIQPPDSDEGKAKMLGELREQLGMLAQIAGNKPNVKEVASTLLPMLPEEMDEMIYNTLSADNWFDRLCFIQPAIKPHKEWFAGLRDELLASFTEVDPDKPADAV